MGHTATTTQEAAIRPMGQSIRRGMAGHCPACGEGPLFSRYLKVAPSCSHCGEELHHQRADDGPAYLTMLVICHIAGFLMHFLSWTDFSALTNALITTAAVIPSSLLLLPRFKGMLVGIQWAKEMHGFGKARAAEREAMAAEAA